MPNLASITDFVEYKHGFTHFVEIGGVTAEQTEVIMMSAGVDALERIVRFQSNQFSTVWLVIDDINAAKDLVKNGDAATRFIPTEEALAVLGINKPYFKVVVPNNKTVNIARPLGQISVLLSHTDGVTGGKIYEAILDLAKAYGKPICIALDGYYGSNNWQFIIEYQSISSVGNLIRGLGVEIGQIIMPGISARCQPAVVEFTLPSSMPTTDEVRTSAIGRTAWVGDFLVAQPVARVSVTPAHAMGPTGSYQGQNGYAFGIDPYTPTHSSAFSMGGGRGSLSGPGRRRVHSRLSQDVEIIAIENGADVRTTLMIRNLPHRFNYQDVKSILDDSSKGHFDFLYVRMDFARSCNVGYAFVNFVRPEFIVPFIKARVHKPWPGAISDKLVEVSYATIQGQDCLIQKFRNSSVMAEYTNFRPKLLYTVDSPNIPADKEPGDEAPFPASDNRQKFTRSVDNAKTIGLYPPRGHKGGRESRRPHTRFDRGTPGAMQDEAAYVQRTGGRFMSAGFTPQAMTPHFGPITRPGNDFQSSVPRYMPTLSVMDAMPGAEAYYTPSRPAYGYHLGAAPASGYPQW